MLGKITLDDIKKEQYESEKQFEFYEDIYETPVLVLDRCEKDKDFIYFIKNKRHKDLNYVPYFKLKRAYLSIQFEVGDNSELSGKMKEYARMLRRWITLTADYYLTGKRYLLTEIWTIEKKIEMMKINDVPSQKITYSDELSRISTHFKLQLSPQTTTIYDFLYYRKRYVEEVKNLLKQQAKAKAKNRKK